MKETPSDSSSPTAEAEPKARLLGGKQWLVRVGFQSLVIFLTVIVCIALVGLAQRIGWIRSAGDGSAATMQMAGDEHSEHSKYTCPMHPEIRQDEPGKCPICGMKLVAIATSSSNKQEQKKQAATTEGRYICPMMCTPASSEAGKCPVCAMDLVKADSSSGGDERSVSIESAARRILGIRTAKVKEAEVYRSIRTVGGIDYDEQRVATIAAYVDGRIEELYAEYVGIEVAKGDALAVLYSPQLYSAQVEYLSSLSTPALNALTSDGDRLSNVARDNLSELGMTDSQVKTLQSSRKAQKRLRIASPIGGTVIAKHKVEGDYVKTGEAIYRVVDLSTVWLMLDLYPNDAAAVKFGQQVEAEFQSLPGEVYTGRVAFIDPMVSPKTRTVSVRVEMTNFDRRLKPGDYATATIRVPAIARDEVYDPALAGKWMSPMHPQIIRNQPGKCPICGMDLVPTRDLGFVDQPLPDQLVISVARSAVLMAGDNSVLYVEKEPGVFEIREVTLGAMTDTVAVILDGVSAGETVATDGNFLIDSQMQLGGKPSLMDPARAAGATPSQPAGGQHAH